MIEYFEEQGCLIISKGNVPQYLLGIESKNEIYGNTGNPYNINRTAGGSTGGDSAIVGLNEANVGLGSDIGGSLRIPALFCGIYSIKPTSSRFDTSSYSHCFTFQPYFGKTGE